MGAGEWIESHLVAEESSESIECLWGASGRLSLTRNESLETL